MTLEKERRTVGVFAGYSDAQLVLQELKAANFPMHKVSVVARNTEKQSDIAGVEIREHTSSTSSGDATGAVTGAALDGLTGLLVGLVLLVIPGIGPVILAGAEVTAIATTLAGGLPTLLLSLGIAEKQAQGYSDLVCKGYYLVIITGIEIEIRIAKRIFNRRNIQQWGAYKPYSTPNSRYKHALGIFYTCQDAEKALTELRTAGFPMSQISIVTKNTSSLNGISEVNISSSQDKYAILGISDDLARYYEHHLILEHYLVVLKSTDIYVAGARAILESNKIQHFTIYSPSEFDATRSDRQVMTNL
ncbi:general stress protein [uncultured Nostoc sp.]|uniref:general stress protein n=1 Tax=uncultured Nostoc sp. TaxID=340711 RepID=UPI0035CAB440